MFGGTLNLSQSNPRVIVGTGPLNGLLLLAGLLSKLTKPLDPLSLCKLVIIRHLWSLDLNLIFIV